MSEAQREIARLCENLPGLRAAANEAGLGARLNSLVSAAADGGAEGLTDFLRRMDVPECASLRGPGDMVYPATVVNRYGVERYQCPGGVCDRSWVRPPGIPVPFCAVIGARLRLRSDA